MYTTAYKIIFTVTQIYETFVPYYVANRWNDIAEQIFGNPCLLCTIIINLF